jgi:hypothetical protein
MPTCNQALTGPTWASIVGAKAQRPDALMILPIGIFTMWKRANRIFDALKDIPTLVFSPIGGSFTMETAPIAQKPRFYLVRSLDIADVRPGLEMVKTAAILRQSTLLVIGRSGYGPPFKGDLFGPLWYETERHAERRVRGCVQEDPCHRRGPPACQ